MSDRHGPIHCAMAADHERLRRMLDDAAAFERFRAGLLRHIGMEEKILLPAARRARGGVPLAVAAELRADHGILATLLVPTPTDAIVAAIRQLLVVHDELEEAPGALYDQCDELLEAEAETILERLRAAPEVPLAPHFNGPAAQAKLKDALAYVQRRATLK